MTNLQKVLQTMQANKRVQSNLERARAKYAQKPYASKYADAVQAVKLWQWLPAVMSIAGASLCFVSVAHNLPLWVSILIGSLMATGFELLKSWVSGMGFQSYFASGRFTLLLLATILLYAISIVLSTYGAYNGYKLLESDKAQSTINVHQLQVDSLNAYWSNQIDEHSALIAKYEKQHTDKATGAIRWGAHKQHAQLTAKLTELKELHRQDIRQFDASKGGKVSQAIESLGAYLYIIIGASLLIECVIFCFRRFIEYYDYRSHSEVELIADAPQLHVSLDTIAQLANLVGSGSGGLQISGGSPAPARVGFQVGQSNSSAPGNGSPKNADAFAPRKCLHCNSEYEPKVKWQKFCQKSCNHAYNDFKMKS